MSELPGPTVEQPYPTKMSPKAEPKPHLSRWFWGAIIAMALISFALSLASVVRNPAASPETTQQGSSNPEGEISAAELKARLNGANQTALAVIKARIPIVLDEAYRPVYAAIPTYATYHYSVWGEYAELTAAALGDVGGKLQETLFADLGSRLDQAGIKLDASFNEAFKASLEEGADTPMQMGGAVGKLTRAAINDTLERMVVTAPVGTAAAIGTGVAVKAAVKAMAKKIAAKLAIKTAAKTGGKWAAAGTAAGGGAVLCSWSGPGAGLCAAVGGVGAWIVADYGIVKMDEYWNRAEFEADLQAMVDEQKKEHRIALERAMEARALAVQELTAEIVQNHDFTLRELSGGSNAEVCAIAEGLNAQYEAMRNSMSARTPEAIKELRAAADAYRGNLSLDRLAAELTENLKSANLVAITKVQVFGNLPTDYRANRDVTIQVLIDGKRYEVGRVESSETGGFSVSLHPEAEIAIEGSVGYGVAIEQHLRLRNRYFGGTGSMVLKGAFSDDSGLLEILPIDLPISLYDKESDLDEVTVAPSEGETLTLEMQFRAEPLVALKNAPNCR